MTTTLFEQIKWIVEYKYGVHASYFDCFAADKQQALKIYYQTHNTPHTNCYMEESNE